MIENSHRLLLSEFMIIIIIKDYYYQNINISYQSYGQHVILSKLSTYHLKIEVKLMISVKECVNIAATIVIRDYMS
jgi:hypothetical protein